MKKLFYLLALVCLILSGVLGFMAVKYERLDRTQPISNFKRVETLNSPVKAGEPLRLRIWRDKERDDCPVQSERTGINQDGVVFDMPDAEWAGGAAHTDFLDLNYPTLPYMPAGEYELRVELTYTCPGGLEFNYTQPSALFRIAG